MQRMIYWKRVWLLFRNKIWILVVAVLVGAVLGALGYKLVDAITDEGQYYRVSSDYYITFNEDENGVDYYNAYTWDSILRDDPVVDVVMEYLPEDINREEVKAAKYNTTQQKQNIRPTQKEKQHQPKKRDQTSCVADGSSFLLAIF